jgi:hypothetical protein
MRPGHLRLGDSGLLTLQEYGWIDLGFRLGEQRSRSTLWTEPAG